MKRNWLKKYSRDYWGCHKRYRHPQFIETSMNKFRQKERMVLSRLNNLRSKDVKYYTDLTEIHLISAYKVIYFYGDMS